MHTILTAAAVACGALALSGGLAASAAAQQGQGAPPNRTASPAQAAPQGQAPAPGAGPGARPNRPARPPAAPYVPASFVAADLDIGGSGSFTGVIDPAKGQMCYMLDAAGIGHPTAAKIEAAGAGASGQAVVTLQAPTGGSSGDCAAIPANVARDLLAHPKGYALVIDTAAYPGGALRAPLTSGGPRGAG